MSIVFGIDIGLSGAVALLVNGELRDIADIPSHVVGSGSVKRRVDAAGLAVILRGWRAAHPGYAEHAVMERVSAMPGQGTSSVFSLGHSLGAVQGVVATLGIPHTLVAPAQWKRAMGLSADKAEAQALASQLFPEHAGEWALVKGHNRAESALLAAYAWKERA